MFKTIQRRKIGKIIHLHLYPVKSCGGIELESANMTKRGLETISPNSIKDKEYMIVDALPEMSTRHHKFLTQRDRELQKMALIIPSSRNGRLYLTWGNQDDVVVPEIKAGKELPVRVHSYLVTGVDQGDEVAKMLSDYLRRPVRLVRASGSFKRLASQHYVKNDNTLSYQDAYSISWVLQESVNQLQEILGYEISYTSFRPNIVGSGGEANLEHSFHHIKFGEVEGIQPKPATRCMILNVNQETGVMPKVKWLPLHAIFDNYCWADLSGQRQPIFAENFLPSHEGRINRSDNIFALSLRDPPLLFGKKLDIANPPLNQIAENSRI
jgi:uncharacterized protein